MWRIAKERREETESAEKLKEEKLGIERVSRERSRKKEKKRVVAEQRTTTTRSQERPKLGKRTSQSIV
jgi:hypothetical protein